MRREDLIGAGYQISAVRISGLWYGSHPATSVLVMAAPVPPRATTPAERKGEPLPPNQPEHRRHDLVSRDVTHPDELMRTPGSDHRRFCLAACSIIAIAM